MQQISQIRMQEFVGMATSSMPSPNPSVYRSSVIFSMEYEFSKQKDHNPHSCLTKIAIFLLSNTLLFV